MMMMAISNDLLNKDHQDALFSINLSKCW